MRILHTSDWHLGKHLYDFSLLEDQEAMLRQLSAVLKQERADVLVIAGDIYDRPVPSAQAIQLYDAFLSQTAGQAGIPVLAVAGNHDSASRLEFGSSLCAASGYHVSGRVREEARVVELRDEHGPVRFWLFPYLNPGDVRVLFPDEALSSYDDGWRVLLEHNRGQMDRSLRNVAVAHGFFSPIGGREDKPLLTSDSEINIGGMDIADSGYFSPFAYTALGHLHAPQRAGGEVVRYSGSPLKYSLSEERQRKAFLLVELGARGVEAVRDIPVAPLRDLRTIRGSLEELLEPSHHANQSFDDYVFAQLADQSVLYPMEKLRKLFPHLLGLRLAGLEDRPIPELRSAGGGPRLSPGELFARFFREVKGYDLPEDYAAFLRETLEQVREEVAP